jgi:ribosomal-protein-alanine N-acetyltransferase
VNYTFRPLYWQDVLAVSRWRYPPPYESYNLSLVPLATTWLLQQVLRIAGVTVYYAVADDGDDLVGIFSYFAHGSTVEVGLAMRPDLTGRGDGLAFMQAGLAFAGREFAPTRFRLTVAASNHRAITVYERAGFRPVSRRPSRELWRRREHLEMVREW